MTPAVLQLLADLAKEKQPDAVRFWPAAVEFGYEGKDSVYVPYTELERVADAREAAKE